MNNNFLNALVKSKKNISLTLLAIALIALAITFFMPVTGVLITVGTLAAILIINGLTIVMPGNAGYCITLGHLSPKTYKAGLRLVWPFISEITEVDVRLKKHEDHDTLKSAEMRVVKLHYMFTYQINSRHVALLHEKIGEDKCMTDALCPWLNAILTSIVSSMRYEDLNGQLKMLSNEATIEFTNYVNDRCNDLCDGRPVQLFTNIKVNILELSFDEDYERAIAETARAVQEQQVEQAKARQLEIAAKANAEALKIKAEAEAEALKIKAEAEAEALKLKGASENEVKEKLGIILKTHPELIKEILAQNFPKVVGGTTMLNIDNIVQ